MTGTIKEVTENYGFIIPEFGTRTWHDYMEKNIKLLDVMLYNLIGINNVKGLWDNSTIVTVGDRYFDDSDASLWQVAIGHTTATAGSFATDRAANPTYWTSVGANAFDASAIKNTKKARRQADAVMAGFGRVSFAQQDAQTNATAAAASAATAANELLNVQGAKALYVQVHELWRRVRRLAAATNNTNAILEASVFG